jgi:cytochrome c peroxidase
MRKAGWAFFVLVIALAEAVFGQHKSGFNVLNYTSEQLGILYPPFTKHPVEGDFKQPGITLTQKEQLGKDIIFDYTLSFNPNDKKDHDNDGEYSCMTCHRPSTGWAGSSSKINEDLGTQPGDIAGRFGNRRVSRIPYNVLGPNGPYLATINGETKFIGGRFWDGRASSTDTQPLMPFLNPNELNERPNNGIFPPLTGGFSSDVVKKVLGREHLFKQVYGNILSKGPTNQQLYTLIAETISLYMRSDEVNPFNSKYDRFVAGTATLSADEEAGRQLFFGKAQCSECHSSAPLNLIRGVHGNVTPMPELFSMFCYTNTGVPKNLNNPFYVQTDSASNPHGYNPDGVNFIDIGLAGNPNPGTDGTIFLGRADLRGLFKVPTLRNTTLNPPEFVQAYMHNGVFKSLEEIVFFYRFRNGAINGNGNIVFFDLNVGPPAGYKRMVPPPEVLDNVVNSAGNTPQNAGDTLATSGEVGNINITDTEAGQLIAFLKILNDVIPKGSP